MARPGPGEVAHRFDDRLGLVLHRSVAGVGDPAETGIRKRPGRPVRR